MTDKQLIQRLCDTIDTLSRGGAIEAIRIVREHDRPQWERRIQLIKRLHKAVREWEHG